MNRTFSFYFTFFIFSHLNLLINKEDFDAADLNGEGTLTMEEWKKWIS